MWKLVTALDRQRKAVKGLLDFICTQEKTFQLRMLTQMDPGRVFSLQDFSNFSSQNLSQIKSVAVLGGSLDEPELNFLPPGVETTMLNFDANPKLFDLSKDWSKSEWSEFRSKFDLVLCEQVLEHVVEPNRAVKNLAYLVKEEGFIHISVPAVNNTHGEPHYFFSGFALRTLDYWFNLVGFHTIQKCSWNSDKGARMYSTSDWAPLATSGPLLFFLLALRLQLGHPASMLVLAGRRMRNFMKYPLQPLFTVRKTNNAVVVWCTAQAQGAESMRSSASPSQEAVGGDF